RRARCFQPSRTVDFVSSENFCVGDDDQFCFIEYKAAAERAEVCRRAPPSVLRHFLIRGKFLERCCAPRSPGQAGCLPRLAKAIILPNLVEPLPLPFVVAENVNRMALPQPAMQLGEKFAALRLGHLRLRRAIAQRTK